MKFRGSGSAGNVERKCEVSVFSFWEELSVVFSEEQDRNREMLLLFLALLLTTTTLHIYKVGPNLRLAIADDPCDKGHPLDLTYALLDEFKDEATMLLPGGWLKMTCDSVKVEFAQPKGPNEFRSVQGSQIEENTTTLTVQLDSSSMTEFRCQCIKRKTKISAAVQWMYTVCNREQYNNSSSECQLEEVCLVRSSTDPGRCQNLKEVYCDMEAERTSGMEYTTVCLGNSNEKYESECEAGAKAGANDGWPMVETTKEDCTNEELRTFWEGNFSLRHNIAVKDSLTFRPRNQQTTVVCENGTMTCHRKCIGDREPRNVTGSCSTGWTVTTKMIENCKKTKLYCIYQQKPDQKFRWQFYLYSANVDVTFNGTKAQCEWPGWTGLGTTNPETENRTCQQEFYFPYPVDPEGRKLELGDNTSITDIPTTTTQTTTTPTTELTTKQSTAIAVTASTTYAMSLISNISQTTVVPLPQQTIRSTTVHPDIEKSKKQKKIGCVLMIIGSIGLGISLLILFLVICDVRKCTQRRKLLKIWTEELKEKMKIEEETLAGEKERWDQYERDLETMQFWENKKHWDAMQKEKHEKWMAHQEKKEKVEERRKKEGKPPLKKKEDKEADKKDDKKDKKKEKKKDKKKDKRKSEQKEENSEDLSETPSSGQYIPTIEQPMKPEEYLVKKPLSPYQPDDYRVVGLPDYAKEPKVTEEEMSKLLDRLSSGKQLRGRDMEAEMYRSRVKWGKNEIFTFIERRKQKRLAIIENWKKERKMWCWKIWAVSAVALVVFILLVTGFTMYTMAHEFIKREAAWAADRDPKE